MPKRLVSHISVFSVYMYSIPSQYHSTSQLVVASEKKGKIGLLWTQLNPEKKDITTARHVRIGLYDKWKWTSTIRPSPDISYYKPVLCLLRIIDFSLDYHTLQHF
ncbi:hypothetical protein KQX54_021540 [Cotesia glomerata]|uniref:Uncharacterized protein n=1 Tax=Cotesia glomerata TaxID=32391 RepID=A0AAV7J8S0_COTGL|nr:hypothetical protein KQX54_021540 [Cotesia glomerata]